jgi:hypothetical protein
LGIRGWRKDREALHTRYSHCPPKRFATSLQHFENYESPLASHTFDVSIHITTFV